MTINIIEALKRTPGCIFFSLDKECKYTSFSDEHKKVMKKIFGKEICIGSCILDIIDNDIDRQRGKKNFDKVLLGETLVIDENYGDDSFFRTMWRDTYSPIYDDEENIIGVLVFVQELTEHIKMENRFNELKVFENIVNRVQTGITLVDPNKEDMPIVFVNDGFCKITGYEKNEVLGKNFRFLRGENNNQKNLAIIKESMKNKSTCEVELINYKKDGTKFINLINISPILDKNGEVVYYIGVQFDVTNKIEMGKLDVLKGIASGLTHEINTALVSLSGNLDMISYDIEDMSEKALQTDMFSLVDNIKDSSKKITKIINTLHYLNISSLERDTKKLDIYELIKESIEFFSYRIKTLDVKVSINGMKPKKLDDSLEVLAERDSLVHLWEIIIENALDTLSEKKEKKEIDINVEKEENYTIVRIKDNGLGIKKEIEKDVFKLLVKGKKYKGVGIGLYIAKTIAEMYKGQISFETNSNGTEFIIKLNI